MLPVFAVLTERLCVAVTRASKNALLEGMHHLVALVPGEA